ncbi:cytochrome c maturation protein CcmE [Entomobacter blattae]|uniref:Cytochrome c-type biogenesis protein CcmE n=1 Tax=Entomobacter blattae TaxID=2762277 RepID=A0A7H1NTH1_9PROT|nr:cytochrome c maturation protein CcmE [Entomobacter blattae]QNT79081.1 Cytochrome c-type biogenesis protein CcmE [Entomobacter blattae]
MTRKMKRLWILIVCAFGIGTATALTLTAFSSSIIYFMTPSQVKNAPPSDRIIKLGGMVVAGSLHVETHNTTPVATFEITDGQDSIPVHFTGVLPDLFREGQSAVAIGTLTGKVFTASEVLAKHDETYMPKDVADALQKAGKWDPRFGPPPDAKSWNSMTLSEIKKQDHPLNPQQMLSPPPLSTLKSTP